MYRNRGCLHIFHLIISSVVLKMTFFPKISFVNWQNFFKQLLKIWGKIEYRKIFQKNHSFQLGSQLLPSYQHCIATTKIHLELYSVCWASKNYHPKRSVTLTNWPGLTKRNNLKTKMCLNSKRERQSFIRSQHVSPCQKKSVQGKLKQKAKVMDPIGKRLQGCWENAKAATKLKRFSWLQTQPQCFTKNLIFPLKCLGSFHSPTAELDRQTLTQRRNKKKRGKSPASSHLPLKSHGPFFQI